MLIIDDEHRGIMRERHPPPSGKCQGMLASWLHARVAEALCSKNGVVELLRNSLTNCELTSEVRKRRHSGVIASHSVDTSTWGSGCSTKVKIGTRCAIE
jgi:hypothetical protein